MEIGKLKRMYCNLWWQRYIMDFLKIILIVIEKCISCWFYFKIPIFCIQEFIIEKHFEIYGKIYEQNVDKNIIIKVFYSNDNKIYDFKIRNKNAGYDLNIKL